MAKLDLSIYYPNSEDYYYETTMERINLDDELERDLERNNGFMIADPQGIKKDIKDPDGMFSPRYGQTLKDLNPFGDRYKCQCGKTTLRINNDTICPYCNTRVERVGNNFSYFGWRKLKDHYFIHPNLFKSLEALIGKTTLDNIIKSNVVRDVDGNDMEQEKPSDEPYFGIGMVAFKENFDEILDYYGNKTYSNTNKRAYYEDIKRDRDKVFTQSIPYFSALLRPVDENQSSFYYEDTNGFYYIMLKLSAKINEYDELNATKDNAYVDKFLYDLQIKYNKLSKSMEAILEKKKGDFRKLISGRLNFSSRCVITAGDDLRIDEIRLPYECLVELLQQQIVNILQKVYNFNYSDAYNIWYKANIERSEMVVEIIKSIINASGDGRGIPMLINRNPTIAYGGILQMYCIGIEDSYTMRIPLRVLPLLAADFDGDVLNILKIINDYFYERASQVFNPRNAFQISRNDGKFNSQVNHQRDIIININTATRITKHIYNSNDIDNINRIKNKWKNTFTA